MWQVTLSGRGVEAILKELQLCAKWNGFCHVLVFKDKEEAVKVHKGLKERGLQSTMTHTFGAMM